MDVAVVARRARTENFPVASVLFPRRLRPHLRAVYGFARLVDILGDEIEGDRLAALNELEREVDACYDGEPTWPVMRVLQPTIREFSLPREPFLRLIEANRMDQRVSEYETWADLRFYCVHSADPVGRLVLGLLRRADDAELVAASDDVCTGLQLVNFLQDVPRDHAPGRIYLPAEDRRLFEVTNLDRPSGELGGRASRRQHRRRGPSGAWQSDADPVPGVDAEPRGVGRPGARGAGRRAGPLPDRGRLAACRRAGRPAGARPATLCDVRGSA